MTTIVFVIILMFTFIFIKYIQLIFYKKTKKAANLKSHAQK